MLQALAVSAVRALIIAQEPVLTKKINAVFVVQEYIQKKAHALM
jgi:hypothetical protein